METVGVVILMCVSVYVLRSVGFRGAGVVCAVFFVIVITRAITALSSVSSSFSGIALTGASAEAVECALKVVGLGYLFGATSDVCRTLSENELAKGVEIVGRVEIFLLVLPFVKDIFSLISELVQ